MKKILRIQLNKKKCELSTVPELYLDLGGRGLTSRIIAQEVPPQCDALGKENKLVIAGGILAGTVVPNSGSFPSAPKAL